MSILNPERQSELSGIRAMVLSNTASKEDLHRAIVILREGRIAAQESSKARSSSRSKAPVDIDSLFKELDG